MEIFTEPSSSISFTSSSLLSNGTSIPPHNLPDSTTVAPAQAGASPDHSQSIESVSLSRLSANLERLLFESDGFDCTDAEIIVEGSAVGVHRCILASRSKFFYNLFSSRDSDDNSLVKSDRAKPRYEMSELVNCGKVGRDALMVILGYIYTGRVKPPPPDVSVCVDAMCAHDACWPAISFVVELVYASYVFQMTELVSLFQRRLLNFVDKAHVEDVIPILKVAYHSKLNPLLDHCIQRIIRSDLDDLSLEKVLPMDIAEKIKKARLASSQPNQALDPQTLESTSTHEKRIRRIHRALDSDDVELVKLLLNESEITLDDAKALHYAVSYCDSKVVSELLQLGPSNVNLKNERGFMPLHIAAMRREPAIIVCLLNKGASVLETTRDGRCAVSICRRLTRSRDYSLRTEQGQESNKDRVCIDLLEREMLRNPMAVNIEDSVTSPLLADDLHMKLLYLENRVAFAKLFFPTEAKVAMQISQAEQTSEFAGLYTSDNSGKLKEVDLNETPMMRNKRLRERVDALMKTVEMGRRYFPHCSQVLDKFLEDDLPDLFYLEKGTPDEQKIKRARFCELKEDVRKAFSKDKAGFSSSSSSNSSLAERHHKPRK
ncbi:BTB/POZ domain and ankyrin repeat-containing protein NPR1 [Rhynchospora pubera]|uniref:BTB/POZ domain and ankyrin repeat-containing protein NPR1 n=1 Tax=Rhynchospora pubera TaxID=906938 RepID=A0AAV8DAS8_9POAL|nr:BTB/POZ domain and ankyrin repeat-containing protein NPR1 [Rhynchospora pubera]